MSNPLKGKRIVLGVSGSIACYKAADLSSKLHQAGALVDVILSHGATQFITPLTFRSLTHRLVVTDVFDVQSELSVEHVELARNADIVVVAPATVHTIAKVANGLADDSLTTTIVATQAPIIIAPAMDAGMYENAATQENLGRLRGRGYTIIGPEEGYLASGLKGRGRMVEPLEIIGHITKVLGRWGDLRGQTIVVSAGGTQEPIDPVRVISNRSSGKMGYAIAEAARDRGARVVLVTAPTAIASPPGVELVHVESVADMRRGVLDACRDATVLIMAAAVSDYRPKTISGHKIKKKGNDDLNLQLVKNEDFFLEVPSHVLRVGFAAESQDLLENAKKKIDQKNLALIAANDITASDAGFGVDTNRVTILDNKGGVEDLPLMSKYEVGHKLLDRIIDILKKL